MNSKCVPIPVVENCCDRKCCSIENIPLRVCIAITIHKRQGITVREGKIFEKVMVYLPEKVMRKNPGLEIVAFSSFKRPDDLAVGNYSGTLTKMQIEKFDKENCMTIKENFTKGLNQ